MRILFIIIIIFSCTIRMHGQNLPLFSQKLTNSLIYNPSLAGNSHGSFTYAYRKNYANVKGAPQSNLLSIHTPFANHRFGIGANVFQENINFLKSTYSSLAFAYHIDLSGEATLSAGVSGEYRMVNINGTSNTLSDDPDLLSVPGKNDFDVSFGMTYQSRFIRVSLAANRLVTSWLSKESSSGFFTGTVSGNITLNNGDHLIEPYVSFRKFSEITDMYDLGFYYTLRNRFILGGASRNRLGSEAGNMIVSATVGFRPSPKVLIGYSYETITGSFGGYTGSTNEITLRLDFGNKEVKQKFRREYTNAMGYRKKSLTRQAVGSTNPKQFHKKQQKLKRYTPNMRYQSAKKISVGTNMTRRKAHHRKYPKKRK